MEVETYRDRLAREAMAEMLKSERRWTPYLLAKAAYAYADEMLRERERRARVRQRQ